MAEDRSIPKEDRQDRSSPSLEGSGKRLWRWVFFSCLLHAVIIWIVFVVPFGPSSKSLAYPIYTVEMVSGGKLGAVVSSPPRKKKVKKISKKTSPKASIVKKKKKTRKKKVVKKIIKKQKKAVIKKPKKKAKKKPPVKAGLPEHLRRKMYERALARSKERVEAEEKKQKEQMESKITPEPSEEKGTKALAKGGTGGGIVKGVEFLIYRNRMLYFIRERWTWVGKRTDLEVTVRFGIQESGEIVGLRVIQSSGDPSYDDSVFRAVKKASPLPPPPENYRKDFMDVELTFRPTDLT